MNARTRFAGRSAGSARAEKFSQKFQSQCPPSPPFAERALERWNGQNTLDRLAQNGKVPSLLDMHVEIR